MKQGERICIVDGRSFEVYPKKDSSDSYYHHHGNRAKYKRPCTSITCSRVCARLYIRHRKKYLKNTKPK